MITYAEARQFISHTLHDAPAEELPIVRLVNEAGRLMCQSHPWGWLKRNTRNLSLVENQSKLRLPDDVVEIISARANRNVITGFSLTSPDGLNALIASGIDGSEFYGTMIFDPNQPDARFLRIWPTPTASYADAISIFYRATWRDVNGEVPDDRLVMPVWAEALYWRYLRAVALSAEEDHAHSLEQELAMIQTGPVHAGAVQMDTHGQSVLGPVFNGAVSRRLRNQPWTLVNPVPPPSAD
ncbi:MAG: hypothetical protein EKK62_09595 [Acidimicrobiia bacterium]|nr:MAG: hypothetical protein EKK62_09595 [Acidimicrobiia bacterium]